MFLCLMREHSLRVSTSPEIQDDLPVPDGPATIIPRKKTNETTLGGVNMTPGRLSPRSKFTPVPCHGSIFVYMISPQSVMPARVNPA